MTQAMEDVGLILADVVPHLLKGAKQLIFVPPFITEDPNVGTHRLHTGLEYLLDSIVNRDCPVVASLRCKSRASTYMDQILG